MNRQLRHHADIIGRQEAVKRKLSEVRSRNSKASFPRVWQMARHESPDLFEPDEQGEPVASGFETPVGTAGPNPPIKRSVKSAQDPRGSGGYGISDSSPLTRSTEDKMELVKARIKSMQHAKPGLRFQAAWDSLRATHPHLFDEPEPEPPRAVRNVGTDASLAELIALHTPAPVRASLPSAARGSEPELWLVCGGEAIPYQ